jgi:hypothetical protein
MSLLTQASLIVSPNAVKASKLYSIIPSNGNGDMTVVRATTATRVNSLGLIESVASNVPRLNYDVAGGCPSILIEPQRTNLDTTSQTFSSWNLNNSGGVTTASVVATNPYGFTTVQKVIPSAVLGQHRPLVSVNYSANGRIWVIAKADGYNFLSLGDGGGLSGSSIIFNLSNGTISGTASGFIPSITPLGNGWYQCSINTINTGLTGRWVIIRNNNTTADYVGDGTSGILIAHKQLEVGEYNTSSILTNGGTVTRNTDVISKTAVSALIGQTEGTVFAHFKFTNVGIEKYIILINDASTVNQISIRRLTSGDIRAVFGATTVSGTTNASSAILPNGTYKIAYKYISGSLKLFINGALSLSLTPTFTFGSLLDNIRIGNDTGTAMPLGDSITSIQLYKTALTDTECINLTTL